MNFVPDDTYGIFCRLGQIGVDRCGHAVSKTNEGISIDVEIWRFRSIFGRILAAPTRHPYCTHEQKMRSKDGQI
jgi:hypothetical protein